MPVINKYRVGKFVREHIPLTPNGWLLLYAILAVLWTLATLYWNFSDELFLWGLIDLLIVFGLIIVWSERRKS